MPHDRCDLLCLDHRHAEHIRHGLDADSVVVAARRARTLADPTRLTLALALRGGGELCVCDLAWIAGRADNLVSHHLRGLRAAGLAQSRRDGKIVFYSLTKTGRRLLEAHLPAREVVR